MLLAALGATVIGFILLIVALITASMWLAIACVVVSVVGVLLLLGDVLTYRRSHPARESGEARSASWTPGPQAGAAGAARDERDQTGEDQAGGDRFAGDEAAGGEHGTVGLEEFGHHRGEPHPPADMIDDLHRAEIADWTHEWSASTDDDTERRLYDEPGNEPDEAQTGEIRIGGTEGAGFQGGSDGPPLYDPDLTDYIRPVRGDEDPPAR